MNYKFLIHFCLLDFDPISYFYSFHAFFFRLQFRTFHIYATSIKSTHFLI